LQVFKTGMLMRLKYLAHFWGSISLFVFFRSDAQSIIESNGLVPVFPSADKVMTTEMVGIPGTSYFLTTGDDNSKIWDLNSHKMLAKLTNPNVKAATIGFTTFYHPRHKLFAQATFTSISFYSYPDLKVIHTMELNDIQESLFHPAWDFFIVTREHGIEQFSFNYFKSEASVQFPDGSPTIGITKDSASVYYENEGKRFGVAPVEKPLAIQWLDIADLEDMEIIEVLTQDLVIVGKKVKANGLEKENFRSSSKKEYYFYDFKTKYLKEIKELESAPNNIVYCTESGKLFFNDGYYKNGDVCLVYSIDDLSFIGHLRGDVRKQNESEVDSLSKPKHQKIKQVDMILHDDADNLIWVLYSNGLASFDLDSLKQQSFLVGEFNNVLRVGGGLALVGDDNKLFVIRDYKRSMRLQEMKTDFMDALYKVRRVGESQLDIFTQNGIRRLDLSELKIESTIPLSNRIGLGAMEHFDFWSGRYISDKVGTDTYYMSEDSIYGRDIQLLYYDKELNKVYYWNDTAILKVNAEETMEHAKSILDCQYLKNDRDTIDLEFQMNFLPGRGRVSILQFNPAKDSFYILRMAKEQGRGISSRYVTMYSGNVELIKVNKHTHELEEYKMPKNCTELVSLQGGYFLVKYDARLTERRSPLMRLLYKRWYKGTIVHDDGKSLKVMYELPFGGELIGDSDGRIEDVPFVLITDRKKVIKVNIPSFEEQVLFEYTPEEATDEFEGYDFDPTLNRLILYSFRGRTVEFDLDENKELARFKAHPWQQNSAGHLDENTIYTASNEELKFWKADTCFFQLYFHTNDGFYITDTSDVYYATKSIIKDMYFVDNKLQPVGFEQLDPFCNRPSQIQESIAEFLQTTPPQSNEFLRNAEVKRIRKLGIDSALNSGARFTFPEVQTVFSAELTGPYTVDYLPVSIAMSDSLNSMIKMNILVNEVPILGSAGLEVPTDSAHHFTIHYSIPLNVGENKIQFSVMNNLGLENFKYPTYVNYKPSVETPATLFYVGIGVDCFLQPERNLKFCVKDVRDLATELAQGVNRIDTLLLTNNSVTRESVLALKAYLQKNTTVNDRVIISCSSHGLLDDSLNFYLAMHDVDFKNPAGRGLKYEELEGLLDGIPARQKLLLLDACNSGENDKTELLKRDLKEKSVAMDTTQYLAARGVIVELEEENQSTFKKMNELFVNVRNNTGSVIISAAGGQQSALEAINVNGEVIQNGAFTFSVLECLRRNKGRELKVNELKQYTERRVEQITGGKQRPTSRQETMEVDWEVINR